MSIFSGSLFSCGKFRGWRLLLVLLTAGPAAAADRVEFNRDIQPILADHCFPCHGRDEGTRKGGLRLDLLESALRGGDSEAAAIVPGRANKSELIARILSTDDDLRMPPVSAKHPLKPADIEKLRRWINDGAEYAKHWAFESPVKQELPRSDNPRSAGNNPIDAFVVARLTRAGLSMSPPASPEMLCRRLHLDLIGLPPTPREVAAFAAEAAIKGLPNAAASLSDRLLQDQRFGEKWARHWLDAARYADSNGYEKDLPREQWAWRDWVIRALNDDLPYDRFIIEQIAGDLLPDRTSQQLIATGFLRNGMLNEEGAIVPEQFRMEGMFDRMDTVGTSVLGLTLKCAQCHTHKFDPITQTEYFQMFSLLNNTYEAQSWVYSEEQQKKIAEVRTAVAAVESRLKNKHPDWPQRLAAWEAAEAERMQGTKWSIVEAEDLHSSSELNHPTTLPDKSILTLGHRTVSGDVHLIAQPIVKEVTGIRLEVLSHGDLPFDGPGRSFKGTWALTELVVEAMRPGSDKWERLKLVNASADFAEPSHGMEPEWSNQSRDKDNKRTCGPAAFLVDGDDLTAWRADRGAGRRNTDDVAVAQFEKPLTLPEGTKLKIALVTNHGGDDNGSKNTMIGRFRVALTTAADPRVNSTAHAAVLAMGTPREQRTTRQQAEIFAAWRGSVPELQSFNDEIEALWKQFPEAMTSVLHLAERSAENVRNTFVLDRGAWDKPKEQVDPGVTASLHPLPADAPRTRLTFARWLADSRSPLTARVAVNRVWQAIFGIGIQETTEDFGTRAPEPSHPELLDWLAADFMQHQWSQKYILRTIVTSAAYQQTSRVTAEIMERDPRNRLLSRGPRFRAEAEVVRDIALSAAGLLTERVGGPSIFPPVPQSVLEFNYVKPTYWKPPEGDERYRRSLYLFRKRSMPDPVLSAFDAPNGDFTCPRRARSNSPLASLTAMNETVFVEAARALALRVLREGGTTDAERVDYALRLCTGRAAKPAERVELLKLLASRRLRIAEGWLSPREIATGDPTKLPPLPTGTTPQDAAAWTIVARVLLNLDETVSKG
ncbi:MAG: PSD1 domain-containing protein [Planctomycetales bacterium]|nr:PSD1 domain-containing protein [Planctomycetales bacterium]